MDNNSHITNRGYRVPFILVTTLFFLWGFARAILDVLNKHLQNVMDITITRSALIQVTTYLGYFLMAIPAGWFINRQGYRRGVVLGLLLFGTGALLIIPAAGSGTFWVFLVALFIIGCGLVCLETSANPYVTELGPRQTASSRLNLSQSFNGLGSLSATFFVGQFFFSDNTEGGEVAMPYAVLAVVVLLIAVVFSRARLPEIEHEKTAEDSNGATRIQNLFRHHPLFVFGLFTLLAYEVAEISINSYFINFMTSRQWVTDNTASIILTVGLALFMAGRFLGAWIMRRMAAERLLFICACGSLAAIGIVLLDMGKVSIWALLANYLFEAIMFPTIFSLSLRNLGGLTKSASSLLMMTPIGGCGFLLMGIIADSIGPVVPFIIPFIGFAVIAIYALRVLKN